MPNMTGEFPRAIPRPVWLTARARNAVHRPIFIGAVSLGTFVAALVALVLAPPQLKHPASAAPASNVAKPDTAPLIAALLQASARLKTADSSLTFARAHVQAQVVPKVDSMSPRLVAQRDSLSSAVSDLDALLTRAESAPVSASYRALAESPRLAATPRVKALIDSLNEVERDRAAFGTTGGADPVYVALTARSAEIGRSIQAAAQTERDALRDQVSKISVPAQPLIVAATPSVDTAGWVAERDSARSLVAQASTVLAQTRVRAKAYDAELARERAQSAFNAPPVALLAAALVFGIVLGFGSAFVDEMRHPRVSDEHEVERVTGTRVLATIRPRPRDPDRRRRLADKQAPPYFDPAADAYQLTYLHVARAGASRLMLTIAGADTGIAAVVGANVAAIAADEARSTIIIDTESRTAPVAAALRIHAEPGVADIVERHIDWPEVTAQAMVGRDRTIDVLPSGITPARLETAAVTALFRQEAARLSRHYEAIVIVTSVEQAVAGLPGVLAIPDTILCARVGHTRIASLQSAIDGVRSAGGNPLGIVLWDAVSPALPTPERIADAPRPLRTEEMRALTTST